MRAIEPSARGELEITDAIQWLIDHGRSVHPHIVSGWWKDTGKVEDMLEANRIILDTFTARGIENLDEGSRVEGKVVIEPGARIYASTIRGPAIIGEGTEIRGAFVGPYTSIGPNCRVERCEIENSIVLEGSALERIPGRIADSLTLFDRIRERGQPTPSVYYIQTRALWSAGRIEEADAVFRQPCRDAARRRRIARHGRFGQRCAKTRRRDELHEALLRRHHDPMARTDSRARLDDRHRRRGGREAERNS